MKQQPRVAAEDEAARVAAEDEEKTVAAKQPADEQARRRAQ